MNSGRVCLYALCFFALCGFSVAAESAAIPPLKYTPPTQNLFKMSDAQLKTLHEALKEDHKNYDPAEHMLKTKFSSPGYHTVYKGSHVHRTRDSLVYATALLDTGDPELAERAYGILDKVISLQDQDPKSRTYGIWSWFYEEPLEKMSPPDWNWADFCGVQLLQVARDHRHRLPVELAGKVDESIYHAVRSIIKRNVGPGYTNIAIMGTYVTLLASELYGLEDVGAYAAKRLNHLYNYTMELGGFNEYNSPTYSMVALHEISRMRQHIFQPEARRKIEELYDLVWQDIARHFHVPTMQWAGPHSRCYSTLLSDGTKYELERGLNGLLDFAGREGSIAEQRLIIPCPEQYLSYFRGEHLPREVIKKYANGNPPVIGTTWLTGKYTVGSANHSFMWNQRRNLLAYWGTAEKPAYMALRLLRNGYDFSDGYVFTAQKRGKVLGAVNFALDGGNTHCSLDRIKDGKFDAEDLRIRFEFGGSAGDLEIEAPKTLNEPVVIKLADGVNFAVAMPFAEFGGETLKWEAGRGRLDCVIYAGAKRDFALTAIDVAAFGFGIEIAGSGIRPPQIKATASDGRLDLKWDDLKVGIPVKPAKRGDLVRAARW